MIVLADTHALIWWLTEPSLLGDTARRDLRAAHDDADGGILVSVATRIDLHYLAAKGKLARAVIRAVWDVVHSSDTNVRPVPVTAAIAERFGDPVLAGGLPDPWDPADRGHGHRSRRRACDQGPSDTRTQRPASRHSQLVTGPDGGEEGGPRGVGGRPGVAALVRLQAGPGRRRYRLSSVPPTPLDRVNP